MIYIMFWLPQFVSKPTPALNFILPFLKEYYLYIMGLWSPPQKPETVKNANMTAAFYLKLFFVLNHVMAALRGLTGWLMGNVPPQEGVRVGQI